MYNVNGFSELFMHYFNSKALVESKMPYHYKLSVDSATVSDKKDSPKRMLIVLTSTIATFFFVLFLLLITQYFTRLIKKD
jgi:hypothetical protein